MRALRSFAVFPFAALTLWLGGYDFDTRHLGIASGFLVAVALSVLIYISPEWEK
jgi:hypothetical protein